MFDTHCHLNFKAYKKNLDEVIRRARESGVTHIVIPGTDVRTSERSLEISHVNENIFSAVGIHPHHVFKYLAIASNNGSIVIPSQAGIPLDSKHAPISNGNGIPDQARLAEALAKRVGDDKKDAIMNLIKDDIVSIENLLKDPKVVAVGEVGMDRHVYGDTKYEKYVVTEDFVELQKDLLQKQIGLAKKYNKSLILHNREAKADVLKILREMWDSQLEGRAVFHCCEPDPPSHKATEGHSEESLLEFAKEHGMFIGVDGDVTYYPEKQEFIKNLPLEMLVLETDSPFLLPEPLKTQKAYPNEPKNIRLVAEFVAQLKGIEVEKVIEVTSANAKRLFKLS